MKLHVLYANLAAVHGELMATGVWTDPDRRHVEVELTKEQVDALRARSCGHVDGKECFEVIDRVWVEVE